PCINDLASRGPRVFSVETESDPARLLAKLDALDLFWRRRGIVEYVKHLIVAVTQPDLSFIRCQCDAVRRTAVPLYGSTWDALYFDAVEFLARSQIPDLEPQQLVDVHITQCLGVVDRERTNHIAERPYLTDYLVRAGVRYAQDRRLQPGQISSLAVERVDCVVRARVENDLLDYLAGNGIDHQPVWAFE